MLDAFGKARSKGEVVDPEQIGRDVAERLRKSPALTGKPRGVWFGANTPALGRAATNVAAARRPLPVMAEIEINASLSEWRQASEERSERQTAALEALLDEAKGQAALTRISIAIAAVSAVAAIIAAALSV